MSGPELSSDGLDARRKRMLFRAWHRGIKEMDLIFGKFADAHLAGLDDADLDEFERLLAESDRELFSWIVGEVPVPAHIETPFFQRIRAFDVAIPHLREPGRH